MSDFLRRQVKEWRETHALMSLTDSPKASLHAMLRNSSLRIKW